MNSPEPEHIKMENEDISSPDIFPSNIRCNLESRYTISLGRDSVKEENMSVFVRIRPMLAKEQEKGYKECIAVIDDHTVRMIVPETSARYKNSRQCEPMVEDFSFTAAFGAESGQFIFFQETMLNIIQNFVEGGNSLVFSYGITGSGKTYTLQGNAENPGVIPLSLKLYFASIQNHLLDGIKVKPHLFNSIKALSFEEQKKEYFAKKELLSLYNEECENVPGSFRISSSKTFAMTLCNLFSDIYEEERTTTLSREDMDSAQAATLMKEVIRKAADSQQGVCNVWVSFVEIYNENIFDLLVPHNGLGKRKSLMLKEQNSNVYIDGAREICVSNSEEALKILNIGRKNLSIASTKMNYQSSRSHCIYTIRVVRVRDANDLSTGKVNRLFFCDLAGSERVSKTQTSGIQLKEAGAINTSLHVLGRCLDQLRMNQSGRNKKIIPFRESKLTRIFSGFFLGQGSAVMIANASPSDYTSDETLHVLQFSAIARKLKVNETFFSEATKTLQSFIENHLSNASYSSVNESVDSVDSYELIKEKDEIIDKLVEVLRQLEGKEKEMAAKMEDMEYRIRQEIIREYSEYSDKILEERRIMYEKQIERLKNNYKKILDKRDKMYEEALEKYEDLSVTMDSDEDDMNESSSQLDLDNPDESSFKKSKSSKEIETMTETINNQNEEIQKLKSELKSVTSELEKTRMELLDNQKSGANLETELSARNTEIENLSSTCKKYKSALSQASETEEKYKCDIKDLEEQISSLLNELSAAKESCQLKEFNVLEMKSENEELGAEMKTLRQQIQDYEKSTDVYASQINGYKSKIADLEKELSLKEENYEEQKQTSLNESSKLRKANDSLMEQIKILQGTVQNYESESEDCKKQISTLESEKFSFEQQSKCLLEEKLTIISRFEKENEELKVEIKSLKEQIEESVKKDSKYCSEVSNYESKITDLEKKLLVNEKNYEELMQKSLNESSELKKVNEQLTKEVASLMEQNKDLIEKCEEQSSNITKASSELRKACEDYELVKKEMESLMKLKDSLEKNVEDYNLKTENYIKQIRTLESELNSSAEQYKCQLQEKSAIASGLQKENEELRVELKTLKEQITGHEEKSDSYCTELGNYKSKITDLENELLLREKNYEEQMQNSLSTCSELKKDNEELRLEVKTLKEQIEDKEKSSDGYSLEISSYKNKIVDLECKLSSNENNYKEQIQTSINESAVLKKDNEELRLEVKTLKEQIEDKEKSSGGYSLEISSYKSKIVDLECKLSSNENNYKEQIQTSINESAMLKKENEELKVEIRALKDQVEDNKKDINGYCSEINNYTSKITDLQSKLYMDVKKYEEQIQTSHDECSVLKKENEKFRLEMKTLKEQIEANEKSCNGYSSEISNYKRKISNLEDKLLLNEKQYEEQMQNNLNSCFELKQVNEQLQKDVESLKEENMALNEKIENQTQSNHSAISKLKAEIEEHKMFTSKLREDNEALQLEKKKLNEECNRLQVEYKSLEESKHLRCNDDVDKDLKLSEVKKENCGLKDEIDKLKEDHQTLLGQCRKVNEEKSQLEIELKKLKEAEQDTVEEKENKINELEKENCGLKDKIDKLKEDHQALLGQCRKVNEEKSQLEIQLKKLKESEQDTVEEKENKINELEKGTEMLKKEVIVLKEKIEKLEEQINNYDSDIENYKNVIQNLEKKLLSNDEQLQEKSSAACKLEKEVEDLYQKMRNKESSIEELEKGLLNSQEQLKDAQLSFEQKIMSIKEQHQIEIEETMKVKHSVEEENINLKKEISELKPEEKKSSRSGNSSKSTSSQKENLPVNSSTRSLRNRRPTNFKETSLTSIESTSPEVKQKARKRSSDEDFEVHETRASKKMKPAASRIPTSRQRAKLAAGSDENLSPIQKFKNSVTTRMKTITGTISTQLASPRMTRGQKKLFNPDAPSSSTAGNVTRGRKK